MRVGLSRTRWKYIPVRSASAIHGSGRFWKDLPAYSRQFMPRLNLAEDTFFYLYPN